MGNPVRYIDPTGMSGEDTSGIPSEKQADGTMTTAKSSTYVEPVDPQLRYARKPVEGELDSDNWFSNAHTALELYACWVYGMGPDHQIGRAHV